MLVKDKISGDVAVDVINECQGTDATRMKSDGILKRQKELGKPASLQKFVSSKEKDWPETESYP